MIDQLEPKYLMLAAFIADAIGLPNLAIEDTLAELVETHATGMTWNQIVKAEFGCTTQRVIDRFQEIMRMNPPGAQYALLLMMVEAGCREPRPYLAMVFGDAEELDNHFRTK
jgi:hypothetical protein